MIGEIWTYKAIKPNNGLEKVRPILVIGNDANNGLQFIDINYVIVSSSSDCGQYNVEIDQLQTVMRERGLTIPRTD